MTRDLDELDRDVEAARVVDGIRRDAEGWAAEYKRREGIARFVHALALTAVAALGAALTWWAQRSAR